MILYHRSNMEVKNPKLLKIQRKLDFGQGFYTTCDLQQAMTWAKRTQKIRKEGKACVTVYQLEDDVLEQLSILKFFIFLLECYAGHKNVPTGDVLSEWDELGITQSIFDNYELYHQESIENAYPDIESLMSTGKRTF